AVRRAQNGCVVTHSPARVGVHERDATKSVGGSAGLGRPGGAAIRRAQYGSEGTDRNGGTLGERCTSCNTGNAKHQNYDSRKNPHGFPSPFNERCCDRELNLLSLQVKMPVTVVQCEVLLCKKISGSNAQFRCSLRSWFSFFSYGPRRLSLCGFGRARATSDH